MSKYHVTFEHDEEGWWVAAVRGVQGCHTQGRSIKQARERILEALALFVEDVDEASLVEHVKLPAEARRVVHRTLSARTQAAKASAAAQESTREAAVLLTRRLRMSVRDAADLLGLSHQRVQQLLA